MTSFWALLNMALHMTGQCQVVTESTHSTPFTENAVLYGGRCINALLLVFQIPGTAWFIG